MSTSFPLYNGFTANQGVLFTDVFDALDALLTAATGVQPKRIVRWFYKGRPAIEGADTFIWWRLNNGGFLDSTGPVRFGNQANFDFTISLETRNAVGKSQVDNRRIDAHYIQYWKMINSFQNNMLFPAYEPVDPEADPYVPPIPLTDLPPLSIKPMLCKAPGGDKVQEEEWTITTAMGVVVPCVLKLTI